MGVVDRISGLGYMFSFHLAERVLGVVEKVSGVVERFSVLGYNFRGVVHVEEKECQIMLLCAPTPADRDRSVQIPEVLQRERFLY